MTERKVDRARRLSADRQRRRRARLRGEVDLAIVSLGQNRKSAELAQTDESPAAWVERTCTVPSGPRRGEPLKLYRWQRTILDTLDNRVTVLRCAAQSGKTAVLLAALAYRLRRGSASLVVAPDASTSGLALVRRRVERQIACCPELAELAQTNRASGLGESARATLRTFRHGASMRTAGAQSPVQLSAEDAEVVIGDELAKWPAQCGAEGDPVLLAVARTEAYRATRWVLLASTPVVDGDPCSRWSAAGDLRRWHVPCGGCGEWWSPEWSCSGQEPRINLSLASMRPATTTADDTPAIVCPACGHRHPDGDARLELLDRGEWRPTQTAPDPGVVSYILPRWLSPASTLGACIEDRAQADRTRTVAEWTRRVAAEPCEPDPEVDLTAVREKLVPAGVEFPPSAPVVSVCGADVQANRIECVTVGRLKGGLLAVTDYRRFYGRAPGVDPTDTAWTDLRRHVRQSGARCCFTDSGYHPDTVVWQHRRDRAIVPIKGRGGEYSSVARGRRVLLLGVDGLKAEVLTRFLAGTLLVSAGDSFVNEHWLRSLFSETEDTTAAGARVWRRVFRRNEVLDCVAYALAALSVVPNRPRGPLKLTPLAA